MPMSASKARKCKPMHGRARQEKGPLAQLPSNFGPVEHFFSAKAIKLNCLINWVMSADALKCFYGMQCVPYKDNFDVVGVLGKCAFLQRKILGRSFLWTTSCGT